MAEPRDRGDDILLEAYPDNASEEFIAMLKEFEEKYGYKPTPEEMTRWANELEGEGGRTVEELASDIMLHRIRGGDPNKEVTTKDVTGVDKRQAENDLRIMGGDVSWAKSGTTWYAVYTLPGGAKAVFEASDEQMDQIFGEGVRPVAEGVRGMDTLLKRGKHYFGGNVTEVTGEGNFQQVVRDTIGLALEDGLLPDWAQEDPQVMDLVFIAQHEDKGQEWLIDQIAKTQGFKQRYQGIEEFTKAGLSTAEAVNAYRQYETGVQAHLKRYGYDDTITPKQVGNLLKQGHSVDDVAFVTKAFAKMRDNRESLQAFNAILTEQGMKPLKEDEMFKFMTGQAPAELYEVWEQTAVLDEARKRGLTGYLTPAEAIAIAGETDGQLEFRQIAEGMKQAANLALQFRREIDVQKYGLTPDDLIDISMGIAPRGRMTEAEVNQVLQRITSEAEGFLRKRITPYTGFTERGRPQARSLGELRRPQ